MADRIGSDSTTEGAIGGTESNISAAGETASTAVRYMCHKCQTRVTCTEEYTCSICGDGFIEELVEEEDDDASSTENEPGMDPLIWNLQEFLGRFNPDANQDAGQGSGPRHQNAPDQRRQQNISDLLQSIFASVQLGGGLHPNMFIDAAEPIMHVLHGNFNDYAWGPEGLDTVVTQLLNNFEGSGIPPMAKTDIEKLPEVQISAEQVATNLQCTVCMEDYVLDEKVKQLSCQHLFHKDCIIPWLERHGTCPICRKELINEEGSSHGRSRRSGDRGRPGGSDHQSGHSSRRDHNYDYYGFE